jgi:hypothetical protein
VGSRAEEQSNVGGASLRRGDGFGAAPAHATAGGFGRRATPIPSTTSGMPPRTVANDRAARADDSIELSFAAEQSVGTHSVASDESEALAPESDASDPLTSELVDWLQFELRRGRDIQQEAVLCALGALAGYAAQQAIREALVKTGKLTLDQAFAVIEARSGEVFFFGERLNAVIVAKDGGRNSSGTGAAGSHASIWKIVSEGGYDAGAINLPDVTDIIKHCAATVGRDEFGIPRVADAHMPNILPREAVSRFWPAARRKLAGKDPMSWPLHLAMAARSLIVSLKHAVRPDIAVQIVMEAAVPMSKIDPVSLPKE